MTISDIQQRVLTLHQQKLTGGQIAKRLGVSRQRVGQVRKHLGLDTRLQMQARKERLKAVGALFKQGMKPPQIASRLELTISATLYAVKVLKLKRQELLAPERAKRDASILSMRAKGRDTQAIAEALKVSNTTVNRVTRDHKRRQQASV